MRQITIDVASCPRTRAPVMTYDQYRLLLKQLVARGNRRSSVEEIEMYYGMCLELEAGYCEVKAEVVRVADRLIRAYRKDGVAFARQSPLHKESTMPTECAADILPPIRLELNFVKTGRPIQDFYNLFYAAHDLAAQSIGWPPSMFATKVEHG